MTLRTTIGTILVRSRPTGTTLLLYYTWYDNSSLLSLPCTIYFLVLCRILYLYFLLCKSILLVFLPPTSNMASSVDDDEALARALQAEEGIPDDSLEDAFTEASSAGKNTTTKRQKGAKKEVTSAVTARAALTAVTPIARFVNTPRRLALHLPGASRVDAPCVLDHSYSPV